jgi:DNA repair ATPase RecN
MKILSIEIANNKRLECFNLTTSDGGNIEVAGTTGTGKTTAISALWEIIEKHPDSLRHGTKKSEVKVKVGDGDKWIIASRKTTKKTSTITMKDQDGEAFSIGDFKKMLSSLSVNPHKIMDMKPKEQVNTLLRAANMEGFDLAEVDSQIADAESDRLDSHRTSEMLKVGEAPEKVEKVSVTELLADLDKAMEVNSKNKKFKDDLTSLRDDEVTLESYIGELQTQIDELTETVSAKKEELSTVAARVVKGKKYCSKLEDIPVDPISEKISSIEEINEKAVAYSAWEENSTKWKASQKDHQKAVDTVKKLRESKEEALDNAKWPLEGLTIEDGEILYEECLLSNLGESKQMLVCAALAVEDIKNHPLKVVRMDGVESMSKEDFLQLQGLFNDNGIQVLSTRVSRGEVEENEIEIVEGVYEG